MERKTSLNLQIDRVPQHITQPHYDLICT